MQKMLIALLAACVLLSSCQQFSKKADQKEIILKALKEHIDQQPGFEANVAKRATRLFNVDRDRAEIVVEFTSRADGSVRLMQYHLRQENGVWTVKDAKPYTPRPV